MPVIDLQAERDARSEEAFRLYASLHERAVASGRLPDMAAAVRAFETWMQIAGLSEAERRRILG
ncbi:MULTISPECIES: hypothetical protein [Methylorubrum]|uniref:hypothetical protein n=1 Tax=Methylorubrum TaxID=2282523 RepID=UPI0020A1058F|nr:MULTISPECIES: hypothetical protein [Methylorubrum]MCP1550682.1 hypothetical protein [Methylorubrum zatmanii]MCP1552705.1 hypothetical protein [Methylorubrum extorquens]MCP1580985.1 hypothetical protein [Methylorubrum extorquens]